MTRGPRQSRFQVGERVSEWTLLQYEPLVYEHGKVVRKGRWKCQCSCGVIRYVQADNLAAGSTHSCGHAGAGRRWAENNLHPASSVFDLGRSGRLPEGMAP